MTTGVIVAAGRGSRLGRRTDHRPKCMVELGGRPLLDWQRAALRSAGVDRVVVVTGYRRQVIESLGVETLHNDGWSESNMVGSLLRAMETIDDDLVVSYSDIVYGTSHVRALRSAVGDIVITQDEDWLELWSRRFDDPLADAETLVLDADGVVVEIGGTAQRIEEIEGQFMGLLAFTRRGVRSVRDLVATDPGLRSTLDTTGLLQLLIRAGQPVHSVAVRGGWCEIDDEADLAVAEELLAAGRIALPEGSRGRA